MDIHILREGEQIGPCTEATVRAMLKEGSIAPTDFAWTAGRENWEPLAALLPNRPDETATEPTTPRQRAFLAYMGIPFSPETTRDEGARLVNDAMENPRDPARLTRWGEERLLLHPELFAAEIQARKENRAQRYLEIYLEQGTPYFDKVTKAHCQVLVGHLDVHFPLWDANEREAAWKYFFPALAEKFPQLATLEGKQKFVKQERTENEAKQRRTAAMKESGTSSSPVSTFMALARGIFLGLLVLGVLWVGYEGWKKWPLVSAQITAQLDNLFPAKAEAPPAAPAPPAPAEPASQPAEAAPANAVAEAPAEERPADAPAPADTAASAVPAAPEPVPAVAPPQAAPAVPPRTSVVLTHPMEVTLAYGKVTVPVGTSVRIVERNGAVLTVAYLDKLVVIPASHTDLASDPSSAIPIPGVTAATANR